MLSLIARAGTSAPRIAIRDQQGAHSYRRLLESSAGIASRLLFDAPDLHEARVAFLVPPGYWYAAVQWGIWRAGGIAVPLCLQHPRPELEYVVDDARVSVLVAHQDTADRVADIAAARGLRLLIVPEGEEHPHPTPDTPHPTPASPVVQRLPEVEETRRALILYTSGTTGRPKGVVTTHANIAAQVQSLVEAWEWSSDDHILHVLPLHHIHGVVNVLTCALWSGACCEFMPRFDAEAVWERFLDAPLTLFMAVPTIYVRLIAAWEAAEQPRQDALSAACRKFRLMVSGSAALPVSTLDAWRDVSGHTLLERYGMTEIGMALSNPLHDPRHPGCVGSPLPGVEVTLRDDDGGMPPDGVPGEILVRGPGVFREYWRRPEATAAAFTGGWFRTGDVAVREKGIYRILGRDSVDILKTGGYKVSALEIEETLREHPAVRECCVVGVPDPEWGERVGAAVVLQPGSSLDLPALRAWARERLAVYKIPTRLLCLPELPRSVIGKVTKPPVTLLFQSTLEEGKRIA